MIDTSKKYRTRDGIEVQVLCTDMDEPFPVLVRFKVNGLWRLAHTTQEGRMLVSGEDAPGDLVEVKPRFSVTRRINIYRGDDGHYRVGAVGDPRYVDLKLVAQRTMLFEGEEGEFR